MKKHKIDQLFAKKLKDHKTLPTERVWETLAEELGDPPRKQKSAWWKVAAVVLLCISAGLWIYQRADNSKNLIVKQEDTSVEQPAQSENATEVAEEKTEEVPLPILPEKDEPSQLAAQQDVPVATRKQEKQNVSATPTSGTPEQPVRSVESLEPVATLSVEEDDAVVENNDFPDEVAVTKVVAEVRAPVKIIYKANTAPETDEADEKDHKFFEIVKDIKNGDLGLAELREAKSELLASAFSRLKDKREKQ